MKQLIYHIGTFKAGSSSLQFFLDNNRDELLKRGIFYPENLYEEGNSNIARKYLGREDGVLFYESLPSEEEVTEKISINMENVIKLFTLLISQQNQRIHNFEQNYNKEKAWFKEQLLIKDKEVSYLKNQLHIQKDAGIEEYKEQGERTELQDKYSSGKIISFGKKIIKKYIKNSRGAVINSILEFPDSSLLHREVSLYA